MQGIALVTQYAGRRAATISANANAVTLLPNAVGSGAGTFSPGETVWITVPASVRSATNAAATPYVYQFTAAVRTGGGLFSTGASITSGGIGVKMADLDNDGDLDFLTDNEGKIFLNDGRGTFASAGTSFVAGAAAVLADVDGDGDVDIMSLTAGRGEVNVAFNDGKAQFGRPVSISLPFANLVGITAGDIDGDGDTDLLVANYATNIVAVRLNDGRGVFTGNQSVSVAGNPRKLALADVDSDGDLDLLVACAGATGSPGAVSVRLNDGTGLFSGGQEVGSGTNHLLMGDLDGDGDLDMLCDNSSGTIYLNNGVGAFALSPSSGVPTVAVNGYNTGLSLGDVDGDGDLDFIVNDYFGSGRTWLNNGKAAFTSGQNLSLRFGSYDSALGDLDGDGDLDLLVGATGGVMSTLFNTGTIPLATTAPALPLQAELYPNPARQASEVHVKMPASAFAWVEIRNALGQSMLPVQLLSITGGVASGTLNTAGLTTGLYWVYMKTDRGSSSKPLELR